MALIDINWSPSRRELRIFGLVGTVFFAALGGWLTYKGAAIRPGFFFLFAAATATGLFATPRTPRGPSIVFFILLMAMGVATRFGGMGFGPVTLYGLAAVLLVAALTVPAKLAATYSAWMTTAFPIGWVVSHIVLALIFFGLFTFVALLFRLIGRDTMTRRFDPDLESYWISRPPSPSKKRYFRQF